MTNYDFASLSGFDFEELARDLLQMELNVTFESFKTGKDTGIDFRFSIDSRREIIVQCKHYFSSGFSALCSHLKREELDKIKKIKPKRYIFVTSVGLTPSNKDTLNEILTPFCKSTGDIYGKDDLNNLLGKFPEIEKKNYKLWLTSTTVVDCILHSEIFNRTELELDYIKNKIKTYVQSRSFFDAKKLLEDLHYCIISGIPGVGKTTLAEILLIDYLAQGYEVIQISEDIKEAFSVYNPSKKQLFYYDDFLGQTSLDSKFNKNEDQRFLQFIQTVQRKGNTRFILTTREYILNQAKAIYEKLSDSDFDARKCIIDISSYSKFDRAKILYNHVYFSNLLREDKEELLKERNYLKIINHPNYSPRIIEWMTEFSNRKKEISQSFVESFLSNLDNPTRLWEHAFLYQISSSSRNLLIVLASLPNDIQISNLKVAFASFHKLDGQINNNSLSSQDFRESLKELEGNFIKIERKTSDLFISFHNPSIRDFINIYLKTNLQNLELLVTSVRYFEQCVNIWELCNLSDKTKVDNSININPNLSADFPVAFWRGLINTFDSKLLRRGWGNQSSEFRFEFILDVDKIISLKDSDNNLQEIINKINNIIDTNGTGNKSYLLRILRRHCELEKFHKVQIFDLIKNSKKLYLYDISTFEEYKYAIEFLKIFPDIITNDEYSQLVSNFEDNLRGEIEWIIDEYTSPDEILEDIDRLRDIGEYFDIDFTQEIDDLEDQVEILIQESLFEEEEETDILNRINSQEIKNEREIDNDISTMFETLL